MRKSSSNENGLKAEVFPNPNALRKWTPAPSVVGFDLISLFTGRIDMAVSFLIPRVYSLDARRPTFRHTRNGVFTAGENVWLKIIWSDNQKKRLVFARG